MCPKQLFICIFFQPNLLNDHDTWCKKDHIVKELIHSEYLIYIFTIIFHIL